MINGADVVYIGEGDVEGTNNDYLSYHVPFAEGILGNSSDLCTYSLSIYPSEAFEGLYYSDNRQQLMATLIIIFSALAVFFLIFVWFVQRRQAKVVGIATHTTAIVSSLFPENVRDRILQQAEEQANNEVYGKAIDRVDEEAANANLKNLLEEGGASREFEIEEKPKAILPISRSSPGVKVNEVAPIADLYPDCTVFFADIVGFTSWADSRNPAEVFILLETLVR